MEKKEHSSDPITERHEYRIQYKISGLRKGVSFVSLYDEGQLIACGDLNGSVGIWSLEDGSLIQNWQQDSKTAIQDLVWVPDRRSGKLSFLLATQSGMLQWWSKNNSLRVNDFFYKAQYEVFENGGLQGLILNRTGGVVISGNEHISFCKVNEHSGAISESKRENLKAYVTCMCFYNHGQSILVSLPITRILLSYNMITMEQESRYPLSTRIGHMSWNEPSKQLLVYNLGSGVDLYEFSNRSLLHKKRLHMSQSDGLVKQVAFALSGTTAVAGDQDGYINLWELLSGEKVGRLCHGNENNIPQIVQSLKSSQSQADLLVSATLGPNSDVAIWKLEKMESINKLKDLDIGVTNANEESDFSLVGWMFISSFALLGIAYWLVKSNYINL